MPKDLGAIKKSIGPRKRRVRLSVEAAKEIKQRPIDGAFELLLDETQETRSAPATFGCLQRSLERTRSHCHKSRQNNTRNGHGRLRGMHGARV